MAEFCKDCAGKCLGISEKKLRRAVMSDEPDLCEGCGQYKLVVVTIKTPIWKRPYIWLAQKLGRY